MTVERMKAAGADNVELMLDGGFWNGFHLRSAELAYSLRIKGVHYAVHTPVWEANLTCENSHIRAAVLETYKQSILLAARLEASHVVLHPGFCNAPAFDKRQAKERAEQALGELFQFSKPYGIKLLAENVGTNQTSLYTMEEYISFCNALPPEGGALLDIGHAHMNNWDFDRLFAGLGERLETLHIHDNDGSQDSHLPMGEGTVKWKALVTAVKKNCDCPHLVMEYDIGTPLCRLTEGQALLREMFS